MKEFKYRKNMGIIKSKYIRLRLMRYLKPWRYRMHKSIDIQQEGFMYVVCTVKFILDKKTGQVWQVSETKREIIKKENFGNN